MAKSDIDFNNTTDFGTVKIRMLKGEKGEQGEKGADGVSGDYSGLTNKPSINGETLSGNKTTEDLGLLSEMELNTFRDSVDEEFNEINTNISDLQDDVSDLQTATNDTGWVDLELNSGVEGYLKYRKIGSIVNLCGKVNNPPDSTAAYMPIYTLPEALRPIESICVLGYTRQASEYFINSINGIVSVIKATNVSWQAYVYINTTYMTAD